MAFCTVMAFEMKPYAPCSAWSLEDLCAAPGLDCDNYCKLALEFYNLLSPYASNSKKLADSSGLINNTSYDATKAQPWVFGWNGGAVGNHAQILFYDPSATRPWMLCDPTVGMIACGVSSDTLGRGSAVSSTYIVNWTEFWNATRQAATIPNALTNYRNALLNGTYKATDCMYCYPGLANFANSNPSNRYTYGAWRL